MIYSPYEYRQMNKKHYFKINRKCRNPLQSTVQFLYSVYCCHFLSSILCWIIFPCNHSVCLCVYMCHMCVNVWIGSNPLTKIKREVGQGSVIFYISCVVLQRTLLLRVEHQHKHKDVLCGHLHPEVQLVEVMNSCILLYSPQEDRNTTL